jgi:predicted small secreted protein
MPPNVKRIQTMKRLAIISMLALLPLIAACNTIHGAGKDISTVGHSVQSASQPN